MVLIIIIWANAVSNYCCVAAPISTFISSIVSSTPSSILSSINCSFLLSSVFSISAFFVAFFSFHESSFSLILTASTCPLVSFCQSLDFLHMGGVLRRSSLFPDTSSSLLTKPFSIISKSAKLSWPKRHSWWPKPEHIWTRLGSGCLSSKEGGGVGGAVLKGFPLLKFLPLASCCCIQPGFAPTIGLEKPWTLWFAFFLSEISSWLKFAFVWL